MKKLFKYYFLVFCFAFLLPIFSYAASLSLSPSAGSFSVGQTFSLGIIVSTPDQAMNAVSGALSFPADLLEVTSLSKGNSIVGLWVQEPSFSNNAGTVNFEGVALNPGFTGNSGRVLSVNFLVKRAGSAKITFQSPAVLANDGQGTNILQSSGSAILELGGAPVPVKREPVSESGGLKISSPTHPDSNKWYRASTAKFIWDLPTGASAVRLLVSKLADGEPTVSYEPAISEKEVSDLEDGVWYLHAQYRDASGWSNVSRFRFQVDTKLPNRFDLTEVPRQDQTDPKIKLVFDASDQTSGIDYYEVRVDNTNAPIWRGKRGDIYETSALAPGAHTITARAIDRAGNGLGASLDVTVTGLLAPTWSDYSATLSPGEAMVAKGRTYPNVGVSVSWSADDEPVVVTTLKSDEAGEFTFVAPDQLPSGRYKLVARAIDERGASSLPSNEITITIRPPAWWRLGNKAVTALSVAIPFVALFIVLAFLLEHSQRALRRLRRKVRAEVREAEESIGKAFDALRDDMEKQLTLLEKAKTKRDLTKEEARILTRVRKNLRTAEKYIKKEIEDIEKEVK